VGTKHYFKVDLVLSRISSKELANYILGHYLSWYMNFQTWEVQIFGSLRTSDHCVVICVLCSSCFVIAWCFMLLLLWVYYVVVVALCSLCYLVFIVLFCCLTFCHRHKNYQDKWWKHKFKYKVKMWNKRTKTRTQRLKPIAWKVQTKIQTNFLLQWNKQT